MGAVVVRICCGPHDLEEVDTAFFKQLEEASCSLALVHMGQMKQARSWLVRK